MKNRTYAREVKKEYLKKLGVEYVSTDGKEIIVNGQVATPIPTKNNKKGDRHYFNIRLYDEENDRIFDAGVHVLNYVWNKEDKPQGMVIDHIDNDANNNDISNLQCITPAENLAKERANWYVYELKCKLTKPRSFYEEKLNAYLEAYEQAKKDGDANLCHKLRSNISQARARLRYWDNHIDEPTVEASEHDCHARSRRRKELRQAIDTARKLYLDARDHIGQAFTAKTDPAVMHFHKLWKRAIAEYKAFCEETKKSRLTNC